MAAIEIISLHEKKKKKNLFPLVSLGVCYVCVYLQNIHIHKSYVVLTTATTTTNASSFSFSLSFGSFFCTTFASTIHVCIEYWMCSVLPHASMGYFCIFFPLCFKLFITNWIRLFFILFIRFIWKFSFRWRFLSVIKCRSPKSLDWNANRIRLYFVSAGFPLLLLPTWICWLSRTPVGLLRVISKVPAVSSCQMGISNCIRKRIMLFSSVCRCRGRCRRRGCRWLCRCYFYRFSFSAFVVVVIVLCFVIVVELVLLALI